MSGSYLLGVDAGQTTVKAVVHDSAMAPIAWGRRSSPVSRPAPGFAERTQAQLWSAAAGAIAEAVGRAGRLGIAPERIRAVGVSGHGDGLHLVDAAGAAVGPAITAMDTRARAEAAELAGDGPRARTILDRSGQRHPAGGAGPLLRWLTRHDPGLLERAATMLFCKDVIRLRLTGEVGTDLSDATATFLDTHTARWSTQVLEAFGLADLERLLPPLAESAAPGGAVTAAAAAATGLAEGTPVVVGLHDVQANSIGMGALVPGRLALVAGSFSTNGVTTTQVHVDPRWQSRVSITADLRIAMSTSATAAPALDWLLGLLGVDGDAERDALFAGAAALEAAEEVPLLLPYLVGAPFDGPGTGTIAGLRGSHTRAHVLRGLLEGIALMHRLHAGALAERFDWAEPVLLGGGLSRSPLYTQLVADVMNAPVQAVSTAEAGAFGAAALAGVGGGHFDSIEAVQELVPAAEPVPPRAALRGYWEHVIGRFDELTRDLEPWWEGTTR
ncbi:FGGY family carbohydrate kinase [Pseudactinotalea sp. HY158]|uniref:FGGY family carbohydrate kinase n=1 Tax=Pseudactinotalea sp. HY158 TaxID=2654547 RepID=UPI00129C59E9|nr:FGGY family carbohydrate kinase [Pseudactinotalea sp. HY158]QGH69988.1 carbohydrate kinase [Pseudactinotalea sp. HY158]